MSKNDVGNAKCQAHHSIAGHTVQKDGHNTLNFCHGPKGTLEVPPGPLPLYLKKR